MPKYQSVRDDWVLPILKSLIPVDKYKQFLETSQGNYWKSATQAGLLTDQQIVHAVIQHTQLPFAGDDFSPTLSARTYLPEVVARRYAVIPLEVSESLLKVATANPYDLECEQALAFLSGKHVQMLLASPTRIAQKLDELYHHDKLTEQLLDDIRSTYATAIANSTPSANTMLLAEGSTPTTRPIVQLVDHIVNDGITKRASDIHLEAEEGGVAVRYRIDGVLQHILTLPKGIGLPLVSRIKIMAHMDIADRLRPQGGRIRVMIRDAHVDLRVSTLPASHGEKVVIRILDSRGTVHSLDALDLPLHIATRLRKLFDLREGLILITGPTGSGKTTTLYAALQSLLQRGLNIITVEDPVEYRVPGIVQVQVNEKAGLTFAAALRSILRQDPDVVLIGEVRDKETAAIAIQAALTGHLVFATLHTLDACSSITRLQDLGVDPSKISAALKGIIAQRLLRRLCAECKSVSDEPVPPLLWNAVPSGATLFGAIGCPTCSQTGYFGRIAVTELVPVTHTLERLIATGAPTTALITNVRHAGTKSLWSTGVSYVLDGITSAEEVSRVLDPEIQESVEDTSPDSNPNSDIESPADIDPFHETQYEPVTQNHPHAILATPLMTKLELNVVDIYLVDPTHSPWRVLALQRAQNTIRPGSWEAVHGKVDKDESPVQAAIREVGEETGLIVKSLYSITVHSFYLHAQNTIQTAIVFCAFVDSQTRVSLSGEHEQFEWLPITTAGDRFTWPRARQVLSEIEHLLSPGTLGTVEDVLRIL